MNICLGDRNHDCLTNVRDTVLLFASTTEHRKGWTQYPSRKTKILGSQSSNCRKENEIDDVRVEILTREASTKYFGQMLTFQQQETTEIKNRIRAAWATFYKYKREPTSKSYRVRHRLRSFVMMVTPTMNYASGTWTLTKEHERLIQATQRKMFRLIIQTKRKYKKKTQDKNENKVIEEVGKPENEEDGEEEKENNGNSEDETDNGNSSNTDRDQDSDIS